MGDSLFTFLFLATVYVLLSAVSAKQTFGRRFSLALFLGGLATLTRYQGLILLPIAGGVLLIRMWRGRKAEAVSVWAFAPWVALALWIGLWGMGHAEQFAGRRSQTLGDTSLIYLHMGLAFLRYLHCAVGIAPLLLMLAGVVAGAAVRENRALMAAGFALFLVWLPVHAAFQSFQYRYLLPMMPLFAIAGGAGCLWLAKRFRVPWLAGLLIGVAILEGGWLSARVLAGTRNTFADLRAAAEYVKESVSEGTTVYSNEMYNRERHPYPVKMRFWSGRDVEYAQMGPNIQGRPGLFSIDGSEVRRPCIFCWHNVYSARGVSPEYVIAFAGSSGGKLLTSFQFENVPRLPDIMFTPRDPRTGGSITSWPLAMEYREVPQKYRTLVVHLP
jgi:hypothetical protein